MCHHVKGANMAKKKPILLTKKNPIAITVKKPRAPRKFAPGNPETLIPGAGLKDRDENGCTPLEARFVEFYCLSWNKSDAVRNAGFKTNNAASYATDLLKKDYIKKVVEAKRKEFREEVKDIRDQLTAALVESAFYDASKYIKLVKHKDARTGKTVIVPEFQTTDALERGAGRLITSIKIGRNNTVEIKLDDKVAARELLARHIGYNEIDNMQKKQDAVQIYVPDNNRGDVIDSSAEIEE